jgi:hypothetical protein
MRIRVKHGVPVRGDQKLEVAGVVDGKEITSVLDRFYVEDGHHSGRFVVYSKAVWEAMDEHQWVEPAMKVSADEYALVVQIDGTWVRTGELTNGCRWRIDSEGNLRLERIYRP